MKNEPTNADSQKDYVDPLKWRNELLAVEVVDHKYEVAMKQVFAPYFPVGMSKDEVRATVKKEKMGELDADANLLRLDSFHLGYRTLPLKDGEARVASQYARGTIHFEFQGGELVDFRPERGPETP